MAVTISAFQKRLLDRLSELEASDSFGEDERATVALDQQAIGRLARMDLLQRQQLAKETHRMRNMEKSRIRAALDRIATEEFGWCAECSGPIAEKRLQIDPTAALCIECAG